MREIKFRAFLKKNKIVEKKYVKKDVLTLIEVEKGLYDVVALDFQDKEAKLYDWDKQVEFKVSFSEIELLQYTGFKDKNGKEICDGYIVSLKYLYDKRITDRVQVVWREDKASFGLKSLKGLTNEAYELYQVTAEHNLEIIGNIYENPELLKDNL